MRRSYTLVAVLGCAVLVSMLVAKLGVADAHLSRRCGNGTLDTGEMCDDGNLNNYDGCSTGCNVISGWICTGKPSTCFYSCGNGLVESQKGERCDDENTVDGDGCSRICIPEKGFVCENQPSQCHCTLTAKECGLISCGNGSVVGGEQCDDGNVISGDGCSPNCSVENGFSCKYGSPSICSKAITTLLERQNKMRMGLK